jgi:hypothetical protein
MNQAEMPSLALPSYKPVNTVTAYSAEDCREGLYKLTMVTDRFKLVVYPTPLGMFTHHASICKRTALFKEFFTSSLGDLLFRQVATNP